MARLFFALWPDEAVRAALARAAEALAIPNGRRVPADKLHATLLFLGQVADDALPALAAAVAAVQVPAFEFHVDSYGYWPRPQVVWLAPGTAPPALDALAAQLRRCVGAAGFAYDAKAFQCHVTIARRVTRPPVPRRPFEIPWPVTDYALVTSITDAAGVKYAVLRRWPLC